MLIAVFAFALSSCGGSPKSDAEKVCNCGDEMVQMAKDGASEDELGVKEDECQEMAEQFEDQYKDNEEAMDEFDETLDKCGERIEEEIEEAMEERD